MGYLSKAMDVSIKYFFSLRYLETIAIINKRILDYR